MLGSHGTDCVPCSFMDWYQYFEVTCCLQHQFTLKVEAISSSKVLTLVYKTVGCQMLEASNVCKLKMLLLEPTCSFFCENHCVAAANNVTLQACKRRRQDPYCAQEM
jgi:hypothetical protein